jgi:hypothetical protein
MTDPTRRPNPNAGKQPARPQPAGARPAPAKPAAAPAARPAAAPARPAARPAQPAPAPRSRPVEDDPPPAPRSVRRGGNAGGDEIDSTTKKGLIAAGIMVVIASVVWIVISNKKADKAAADKALNDMVFGFEKDVHEAVLKDPTTRAEVDAMIKRIDTETEKWKGYSTEPAILADRSRLIGKGESITRREEYITSVTAALAVVDAAASKSSDDLLNARKTLVDRSADSGVAPEYEEKIKAALPKIDQVVVGKMRDEAKAFTSAGGTTPRQGLAKYATAEDYVRKAIEDAKKVNNKTADAAYTEIYKGLIQDSDAYSEKVIDAAFIESIPWKDLLADNTKWSKVTNVPGFSCRVDNGMLTVSPPDAGSKLQGVAGILDQPGDNLRHFQLDMEFSCEGVVTMYFHVSPPPGSPNNLQSFAYDLEAKENYLKAGAKYQLTASYIGSNLVVRVAGNDESFPEYRPDPSWAKRRRGGIAFLIPEGARLKVTKMRLKELR